MPLNASRVRKSISVLHVLVAGAMLSISPLASLAGNTDNRASFAGSYITRAPKSAPTMSVSLGEDGTATLTEDPGAGSVTLFGHWMNQGNEIKVTFNAEEDAPTPKAMVFERGHNSLQPVSWNREAWGSVHPPTMTKASKGKYLAWTAPMQ